MKEQLKASVLAKCEHGTKGSKFWETVIRNPFTQILAEVLDNKSIQFGLKAYRDGAKIELTFGKETPADSFVWPLAADLLGIKPKEERPSNNLLWKCWTDCSRLMAGSGFIQSRSDEEFSLWFGKLPRDPLVEDREILRRHIDEIEAILDTGEPFEPDVIGPLKRLIGLEVPHE